MEPNKENIKETLELATTMLTTFGQVPGEQFIVAAIDASVRIIRTERKCSIIEALDELLRGVQQIRASEVVHGKLGG